MSNSPLLIGTYYSPWTEKARWALDAADAHYRFVPHVAMVGEFALRLRARRWSGRVSAPMYVSEQLTLTDSFDIARHAAQTEGGAALFPANQHEAVQMWNERSERALACGRTRALERALLDPRALAASVPPGPLSFAPLDAWLGRLGTRYVLRKYRSASPDVAELESTQRSVFTALRQALRGRDYLLGAFSYADIAAAVTLAFVAPREENFRGKSTGMRSAWTDPQLARDFADLVEWRDKLYARHRRQAGGQVSRKAYFVKSEQPI